MIELRPSAELSEGELLFGLERSESEVSSAVKEFASSALSAALRDGSHGTKEEAAALDGKQKNDRMQTTG